MARTNPKTNGDVEVIERREWLESLDYVMRVEGQEVKNEKGEATGDTDTRVEVGKYVTERIYLSYAHIFGAPAAEIQDETTPLRPDSIYGMTKAEAKAKAPAAPKPTPPAPAPAVTK